MMSDLSIYLQTTPSLRKRRPTKAQRKLLARVNEERRKNGESPLENLRTPKLDKDKARNKNNMPDYTWNPRGVSTDHIPSLSTYVEPDALARNSVMEKVRRGEITGTDAEEVIRKSKCLAPAYNKGAVQYISTVEAARDAGKKI